MTMQSGQQRNGRMQPSNPAMYPQWAQRMTRRMMQLASFPPGEHFIKFIVHEDGSKEIKIMRDGKTEELGK